MEQLGVVTGVGFGMRNGNEPALWFSIEILEGHSLQIFNLESAGKLIKESKVYDIRNLEGKPCIVESTGANQVRFLRWK